MFSAEAIKRYFLLFVLTFFIALAMTGLNKIYPAVFNSSDIYFLSGGFTIIAFTALLIFFAGYVKNAEKSVFSTFVAIGVKMVLSFVFALIYFVVLKNRAPGSVVLFFVLYLGFTIFVVFTFISILKKKSV